MSQSLRKTFTKKNDEKLLSIIKSIGTHNWKKVAEKMTNFTARQCKDRYNIYLKEANKQEPWTAEEDQLLIKLQSEIGSHWTQISNFFEGRNINNIKNRWHRFIKFRVEGEMAKKENENQAEEQIQPKDDHHSISFPDLLKGIEFPQDEAFMELCFL
ncbi:Myb-like DNA-binding domain containing protein [Trichomonas vaginalis G3]|uniref:Myb-like DNA-binding domain containing protein n=1 Tax=Trichomonas vaginalis (strain ATCC PRA-98 / G3) TaxID=412133 RepID=A2DB42_TRIV3|nr:RNA polymerase II transcription regulator recruiting protein [Trichomonas vaginalis G3]EAY22372.1 Myb-like DNA-binding domain containing protein [Trichomonas vaginalis G3]KAI5517701.1 RNA polymerase II transcription regulator recruiting protein [Trichomonas vaginalis G3]|eukprot:XP_001583358.1 Myb-like DNA-binding domain containing protein [Trichomonas vaginalis G3]